ncbi:putative ABC transporter ATP-binding protein YxlF [Limihaloglobus sulfuriphilus]|uniref:Putative ABC transporter ATP-binding protein YxlF n=1 Tax=Limihaloglobus sulfuriphilus TaxID=1851148 RepID=A0A1R7T5X2_9BACT|nr:ABC transporter ATP-binding protein [Limihaloglobus sulfuriphilus]AQQ71926.1 putative ABC transporter ATP-binding protein YxlF [Limihaloglobus sulfuriphilus]
MTDSKYAIETVALSKAFTDWWGRTKVLAVDGLELKINHNEVYGLLGPNGSGKSTTIKVLLGLLRPSKGRAFVLGGYAGDKAISRRIGFLPEESYLYKYLTARETLRFYGKLFGLPSKVMNMRIDSLLDMVGLAGMGNRQVGTFSKGMARRIGLAQALINDPDLLILDEPTSGLDPIGTRQIKDLIKSLSERGKTVLMCSHLLADVEDVCDRIGILYGGVMQTEGKVRELLQRTGHCQITTGDLSEGLISKIRELIKKETSEIDISSPTDRLEDMFIRIVSQAQQQQIGTSGAVSTNKIGDFLSSRPQEEKDILDELVHARPDKQPKSKETAEKGAEEAAETTKVEKRKPAQEADKSLLKALTEKKADQQPSVDLVEKVEKSKEIEQEEKINKSLLSKLAKKDLDNPDSYQEETQEDSEEKNG